MTAATPVAVLPSGLQTWFKAMLGKVKSEAQALGAAVVGFFEHEAFPFIQNFLQHTALDELKVIEPYAVAAVDEVLPDVGLLFTEPGKFFGIVTAAVDATAQKALAAGISVAQADAQVAESSVVTAVQAAIHNKIAASQPSQ